MLTSQSQNYKSVNEGGEAGRVAREASVNMSPGTRVSRNVSAVRHQILHLQHEHHHRRLTVSYTTPYFPFLHFWRGPYTANEARGSFTACRFGNHFTHFNMQTRAILALRLLRPLCAVSTDELHVGLPFGIIFSRSKFFNGDL